MKSTVTGFENARNVPDAVMSTAISLALTICESVGVSARKNASTEAPPAGAAGGVMLPARDLPSVNSAAVRPSVPGPVALPNTTSAPLPIMTIGSALLPEESLAWIPRAGSPSV